jgi:uncharacterized protein (UPF0332 family)
VNAQVPELLQKASDSLQAAQLLLREHFYDFAASRTYYAMFYIAQAFLLSKGLSFSSHAAVIAAFGKEFAKADTTMRKFHRYLIDAEDLREVGDYGVGSSLAGTQVAEMLTWATEFLEQAQKILL